MPKASVALCSLNARYVHTNLALRSLQAYVRSQWPQAPDLILAEWTINDQPLPMVRRLADLQADLYAFSCYIWNIAQIRPICRMLKKVRPAARIVWGGPEVSFDAADRLAAEPAVDAIIRGEGEAVFLDLLRRLFPPDSAGTPSVAARLTGAGPADAVGLADLPGLTWREAGTGLIRSNPDAPLLPADAWPFPYADADLAALGNRILYYETSRGCPFHCAYCLSALDRTVRHRPLPLVFTELDRLIAADLQQVKLVDRTFNCQPERARRIWQYLLDRRDVIGRTNFHFEIAGDLLDDQAVDLLNQAPPGLFQLEIGLQTIQPAVLRTINRAMDLAVLQRQVGRLRQAGRVHLHLDLIAGLPGETLAQFGESLDWVWRLQPQQLQLGFLKILPGSPMRRLAAERGFLWQDDPPYEVLQSDAMSFADLSRLKLIEQLIDLFGNSGLFAHALPWLAGHWPRPWLFLNDLAAWSGPRGYLDRSLGPEERCRLLWEFGRETVPELAAAGWAAVVWRDLLRLDYLAAGQKDQPAWLDFWENTADPAEREACQCLRRTIREAYPACRRVRLERFGFDWEQLQAAGEVRPGSWLVSWDLSGNRPAVLDSRPADAI